MGKVLEFAGRRAEESPKPQAFVAVPGDRPRLSVVTVPLASGEAIPLLVDQTTWLPRDLPLRWVVLARRFEVAESTLRGNLHAVRLLYAWGDARFPAGLDAVLKGRALAFAELLELRDHLRDPGALRPAEARPESSSPVTPATAGSRALAIKLFLTWALSPANRNDPGADAPDVSASERQITEVFKPLARHAGKGAEREVPDDDALGQLEALVMPRLDPDGRFSRPLVWQDANPFTERTRVRFWLMWGLARDCGLRIGEILSLHLDDIVTHQGDRFVRVVRRPDDPADTRKVRPAVKTRGRAVPMSPHVAFAVDAYLKASGSAGRSRGSIFLVTTSTGSPLGVSTSSAHFERAATAAGVKASWHDLRHAWATDFARDRLAAVKRSRASLNADAVELEGLLTAELRELGGWAIQSEQPMYYARAAIRESAMEHLREVQHRRTKRLRSQPAAVPSRIPC